MSKLYLPSSFTLALLKRQKVERTYAASARSKALKKGRVDARDKLKRRMLKKKAFFAVSVMDLPARVFAQNIDTQGEMVQFTS